MRQHLLKLYDSINFVFPKYSKRLCSHLLFTSDDSEPSSGASTPSSPVLTGAPACQLDVELSLQGISTFPLSPNSDFVTSMSRKPTLSQFVLKRSPTVSGIIQNTMAPEAAARLMQWQKKMKKELGEVGFQIRMKRIKSTGQELHKYIHHHLRDKGKLVKSSADEMSPEISGFIRSVGPILDEVCRVLQLEMDILHPQLLYKGRLDCLLDFGSGPVVVEWKTVHEEGKSVASLQSTYDAPLQLAAYAGAFNAMLLSSDHNASLAQWNDGPVETGLLIYMYSDGRPADVIPVDAREMRNFWGHWTVRLVKFLREKCLPVDVGTEQEKFMETDTEAEKDKNDASQQTPHS